MTTNSYVHTDIENDKTYTYHVTASYNRGESEANAITLETTGVNGIKASVKVAVEGRQIVVTGASDNNVRVIATDGKVLYSAEGDARVSVSGGIYLVQIGNRTTKVIVR